MTRPTLRARVVDMALDHGLLPEPALRWTIRRLLGRRLAAVTGGTIEDREQRKRMLLASLDASAVTVGTDEANAQHYEVPVELFEQMLGPRLKYSAAWWPPGVVDLTQAEEAMLALSCDRAELSDGQDVLELGCGWGSLTLWMAERYPGSRIVAVSNSASQRRYIEHHAARRGLANVTVLTCDVGGLGTGAGPAGGDGSYAEVVHDGAFDRVVSVEMFEHVRNHGELGRRIARWLRPGGKLFVQVFAHATDAYPFEAGGDADWMARHFFTGGMMPSHDLLLLSIGPLIAEDRWALSGVHYARTLRAWLERLDADPQRLARVLDAADGPTHGTAWLRRWRVFTIACEELFAYDDGDQWHITHLRFVTPTTTEHR